MSKPISNRQFIVGALIGFYIASVFVAHESGKHYVSDNEISMSAEIVRLRQVAASQEALAFAQTKAVDALKREVDAQEQLITALRRNASLQEQLANGRGKLNDTLQKTIDTYKGIASSLSCGTANCGITIR